MASSEKAPTLTKKQKQHSVGAPRRRPMKAALCTPYNITWPQVPKEDASFILQLLERELGSIELRKPSYLMRHDNPAEYKAFKKLTAKEKKERLLILQKQRPAEEVNLMRQLVVGFKNVNKYLERDGLCLVLASRESWILIQHLVMLVGVRQCPAIALTGLEKVLASKLGVTKLSAVGFKKKQPGDSERFDVLIDQITSRCPPIHIPWLDTQVEILDNNSAENASTENIVKAVNNQQIDTTAAKESGTEIQRCDVKTANLESVKQIPTTTDTLKALDFIAVDDSSCETSKTERERSKGESKRGLETERVRKAKKVKVSNYHGMNVGKMVGNPHRKTGKKK